MSSRKPPSDRTAVTAYINAADEPARSRLRALRKAVREEAPGAIERISYGLATWHHGENLIHLGAFRRHIGVYPGPAAIVAFAKELQAFKTSKGTIQVPHDAPLPLDLVRRITRWRLEQATQTHVAAGAKRRPAAPPLMSTSTSSSAPAHDDIVAYNSRQPPGQDTTCAGLLRVISAALPDAECKIWHGHPVWFLDGNPVVGYSAHKESTRLLLWSGQSFDDAALSPVGRFKAAEARFASADDIHERVVRRWLESARRIQWDSKSLVKNKGALKRLR